MRSLAQGRTACRRSSHSKREFEVVPVDHLLSPAKRLQAAPSSATNASLQPTHELLEQIETILRPGARFGVVLHAERIFARDRDAAVRSEEHTSELQSLMRISYAVFCLKKKNHIKLYQH